MSIPLEGYNKTWFFNFKPLYSLIMFLGISICVAAAAWQYQKSMFFLAPVAQQVHMEGEYLNDLTHYLDNQTLQGQAGYAVITPFEYENTVYLINRGFISFESRDYLPFVEPVLGKVTIEGLLLGYRKPMLLNSNLNDPLKKRIQFIDEQYFSSKTSKNISKDIFHLKNGLGLLTLQPVKAPYLSHHRHKAYALQWILLAFAGIIILFISSISRGKSL